MFVFLIFQLVYSLSSVERVPDTTEAMHIRVVNEGNSAFFLLPLFVGHFFLFWGIIYFDSILAPKGIITRRDGLRLTPIFIFFVFAAWFWIPASWNNVWVDFDSQVVVERDTYLFPRLDIDHQLSFSDIDYVLWDVYKGDVLLVKNDESEFKLYDSAFGEEGQRLAHELSDLMDKPLEVVEYG